MRNRLNIWIFLGTAGIVFSFSTVAELLAMRIFSGEFMVYSVILRFFSLIVFVVSFFLTALCTKNKLHIIWFFLLYGLAITLPPMIGVPRMHTIMGFGDEKLIYAVYSVLIFIVNSSYGILLYLGYNWFNKQKRTRELEKQNLQSELTLLKNQINPHFLFNTLNNIDSLIKRNPDHASASIIELSDMMRYMIYETNASKVPLKKELDYIDNYLHLQQLQYANPDLVEYSMSGNPDNIEVAPMLFISFIENAFKHCTNKDAKYAIRIHFRLDAGKIYFEAINQADKSKALSKDSSSGIGLETVKRRLEILYPEHYSLQIEEKNDLFCVSLMIQTHD